MNGNSAWCTEQGPQALCVMHSEETSQCMHIKISPPPHTHPTPLHPWQNFSFFMITIISLNQQTGLTRCNRNSFIVSQRFFTANWSRGIKVIAISTQELFMSARVLLYLCTFTISIRGKDFYTKNWNLTRGKVTHDRQSQVRFNIIRKHQEGNYKRGPPLGWRTFVIPAALKVAPRERFLMLPDEWSCWIQCH